MTGGKCPKFEAFHFFQLKGKRHRYTATMILPSPVLLFTCQLSTLQSPVLLGCTVKDKSTKGTKETKETKSKGQNPCMIDATSSQLGEGFILAWYEEY